jgi:hypothetical protein
VRRSPSRKFFVPSPKMTLSLATMLHSEFPITPTWRANCQEVRHGQTRKWATQVVVRRLMGGLGPKSVGGSSWMNSELGEDGKDTVVLDWSTPPRSKTLRPVWWNYAGKRGLLEWSSRPPYMADGLGFPFEVGGPSSRSVTNLGRSPSVITERIP